MSIDPNRIIDLTPQEIHELSMRYMMGVTIGELLRCGVPEDEIRTAFDMALEAGLSDPSIAASLQQREDAERRDMVGKKNPAS